MVPSSVTVHLGIIVISTSPPFGQKVFISNKGENLILFLGIKSELKKEQVPEKTFTIAWISYFSCDLFNPYVGWIEIWNKFGDWHA